jgi:hypothetical protein
VGVAGIVVACAAMVMLHKERTREPMVIRIAQDGMPQAVTLTENYTEPNETDLRWFGIDFARRFMLGDSYSVRQDYMYCAERMVAERAGQFLQEAKGTAERAGAAAVIESLKRRTHIPLESMEVSVDKRPWPWRIEIKGERRVVGDENNVMQWKLQLKVVKASRRLLPSGLLVYDVEADGRPVIGPALRSVYGAGVEE